MRLTIFSRLSIGYALIIIFVTAASVHAVMELLKFKEVVSIIEIDKRADELQTKLTDAFLSEIRNEMKFIILRDQALYEQSVVSKDDFYRYLAELKQISFSDHEKELLSHVEMLHRSYSTIFTEELSHIEANKRYPQDMYKKQKEQAINGITSALADLERAYQQNTVDKLASLGRAGVRASEVAMITTVISLVIMVVLSALITRSITKPIAALKERTEEIAAGNFESTVRIASPPEMSALADAFNGMCERLQAVDRMKADFYALMSHELRTPLTSIKEGTNMLLEGVGGQPSEKQTRLLSIIAQESERLIKLVNSLLDLSKMEAGMTTYHFSMEDLPSLIQNAMTEVEPLVESKQIRLTASLQAGVAAIRIDGERVLQVIRNLLANAIKVTPKGGSVSIAAQRVDEGVAVSVSDTGPGIAKESLATIFDKYSQVTGHQSGDYRGTGLGLAIVRRIINAHGGKVWAESQVGRGSTFTFVLPV